MGWEVICDKAFFQVQIPTMGLFRTLCTPVVLALDRMGLKAEFRPRNDIEINGRKISGTGGTDSKNAFLFQGTLLTDFDVDTMLRALRVPVEKLKAKEIDSVRERVTCLKWELEALPPLEEVKAAICYGFERHLGICLEPGGLTKEEERLFDQRLPHYQSSGWIDLIKPRFPVRDVVQAAYKTEAGLVRFTVVVHPTQNRIKDIYITGDILAFPSRAIYDLEARLRGMPLDSESVRSVVRGFFEQGLIQIPGMSCEEFLKPLDHVFRKLAMTRFGIPLEMCNAISVTNGSFSEIIGSNPSALLLPYCSKRVDCELRYQKGCTECGECTIGHAWSMGKTKDMEIICIVSFEDLKEELLRIKEQGISSFIGCCCQPFFTKHVDDFEEVGLPGILLDIDNTTCYDLDQAKEAYAGTFSSQTSVNLPLLQKVLDLIPRGKP